MALSYPTAPTVVRVSLTDLTGFVSVKDFFVPTAVWDPASDLFSALVTIRDDLVTALNAMTDCLLSDVSIHIAQKESILLPTPVCSIAEIASIVVNLAGGQGKKAILKIPGPDPLIFQDTSGADRNRVDLADAAVIAYVDEFQTTGGSYVISDGEFIDDTTPTVSGKRITRGSSRKA